MATTTAKPKKQSSARTNGRGSVNQRKGSSRATKQRQGAGNARASTAKPAGRSARARPAAKRTAGRARPAHVAKRALKVASEAGGDGAGKFETLSAFWRVGRLAWRVARGKRPNAKQLRKAAASASEVAGKALAKKAPQRPLRPLAELVRQGERLPEDIRRVPVQRSLDVAVPLDVAYEEWMHLDALPEGAHRVEHIKRRGRRLVGQVNGLR